MSGVAAPGPTTNATTHAMRRGAAPVAAILVALGASGVSAQEPIAAVWKERQLSFTYSSNVSVYSCSALASRVATILRAVGARDDVKVRASHCDTTAIPADAHINRDPGGLRTTDPLANRLPRRAPERTQSSVVRVQFMVPTEVTPDVAAELKRDKSRRELVSHVTGDPLPRFNDPVMFAAQRQQVTLSRKSIGLEPEECELLDQMASSLFRELDIDVLRRNLACDPGRSSHIPPEMVVEALIVAPANLGGSPPEPEEEADPGAPVPAPGPAPAPTKDDVAAQ